MPLRLNMLSCSLCSRAANIEMWKKLRLAEAGLSLASLRLNVAVDTFLPSLGPMSALS